MSPPRDTAPSDRDASSSSTNVNEPANSAVCGDALASGTNAYFKQGDGKGRGLAAGGWGGEAAGASLGKPEANGRQQAEEKKAAAGEAGDPSGPAAAEAKRRRFNQLGRHHTMGDPTDTSDFRLDTTTGSRENQSRLAVVEDSSDQSSTDGSKPSSTVSRRRAARLEAMKLAKSMDTTETNRQGDFEPEETPKSVLDRPIPRQRTESKGEAPVTARRRRREKQNRDKTPPLGQHQQKPSESSFDEDVFDTPISGKVGEIVGGGGLSQLNPSAHEFVPKPRQPQEEQAEVEKKREAQLRKEEEKQQESKRHQNVSLTLSNMKFPGRAEPVSLPSPCTQETQTVQTMPTRIFMEKSTQTPDNFYPPIPTQDKAIDANQFVDAATITSTWSFDSHADLCLDLEDNPPSSNAASSEGADSVNVASAPAPASPTPQDDTPKREPEEENLSGVAVSRIFPTPLSFSAHVTVTPPGSLPGSVPGSVPGTPPSSSKPGVAGFPSPGQPVTSGLVHQNSLGNAPVVDRQPAASHPTLYPQSLSVDTGTTMNMESPVVVLPLPAQVTLACDKPVDQAPVVQGPPVAVAVLASVEAAAPSPPLTYLNPGQPSTEGTPTPTQPTTELGNEAVLPKLEKARARRRRRMDRKKKIDAESTEVQNENLPVGGAAASAAGTAQGQTKPTAAAAAVKKNMGSQQLNNVSASENVPGSPTMRKVSLESNDDVFVLASENTDGNNR